MFLVLLLFVFQMKMHDSPQICVLQYIITLFAVDSRLIYVCTTELWGWLFVICLHAIMHNRQEVVCKQSKLNNNSNNNNNNNSINRKKKTISQSCEWKSKSNRQSIFVVIVMVSNKTVFARTLNSDYSVGDKIYISFPLCINFFGSVCSPFSYKFIYVYVYTYENHYITSCTSRYDYRRVACSILWAQHPVSLGAVYIFSNTGHMRTHLHIFNAKRPIRSDQSWAELNWAEQRKAT